MTPSSVKNSAQGQSDGKTPKGEMRIEEAIQGRTKPQQRISIEMIRIEMI
ncbi:MAG: hypothetical protein AAF685_07740 [Cyanobacteria bacterium P01_C01_bin.89]